MHIQRFGIVLRSLRLSEIEMVRNWRNDDFIRSRMIFQEFIKAEDQTEWFKSLDDRSLYLIIEWDNKPIGLINVKEINWKDRTGESGIFIGESEFRNQFISLLAIHALLEVFFENFGFIQLSAKTIKDNEQALLMNQNLGYEIVNESNEIIELMITPKVYFSKRKPIDAWLNKQRRESDRIDLEKDEERFRV